MKSAEVESTIQARGCEIFEQFLDASYQNIDRMFAILLFCEWLAAIGLALIYSPLAWAGHQSQIHIHVWIAIVVGGLIISLPILLAVSHPGTVATRTCVSIGQMLMVCLWIHLAGGRPEFHFNVFVSLAFLALYRDWRILAVGGMVVAIDHFLRGRYWPRSVFGLADVEAWRWVEHSLWVIFELAVLSIGIRRSHKLILEISVREAEIEATRDGVERLVATRTSELEHAIACLNLEVQVRTAAEAEACVSRKMAEAATLAKSQFLANMSHEIRTPMNAIIGMTELTLDMDMPKLQRDYLEIVRDSSDSLLYLIDEILDYSRIEADRLELESIPCSLREIVVEAVRTMKIRADLKNLVLRIDIHDTLPRQVMADPHRLRQVLLNLLGNAIKFTSTGLVEIALSLEDSDERGFVCHFLVKDDGIGIPKSSQSRIFEPFIQGDGSTTRQFGGSGLGLSICSRLIDLMGGKIWVKSEPGQGSEFHFTARFAKVNLNSTHANYCVDGSLLTQP